MMQLQKRMRVTASVSDAYDGLVRIAVDAQRFGFTFDDMVAARDGPVTTIAMTILADLGSDCAQVASRLGRHPAVRSVHVVEVDADAPRRPALPALPASARVANGACA